jgi:hypothetical protein
MNGTDKVTLFVLCAAVLGSAGMAYRGRGGYSDSLVLGGWLIALAAVLIGAAWIIAGQNPLALFLLRMSLPIP